MFDQGIRGRFVVLGWGSLEVMAWGQNGLVMGLLIGEFEGFVGLGLVLFRQLVVYE